MRLFSLIACLEYALIQTEKPLKEMEVSGISYDSRNVKSGDIFVCLKGFESDGHAYIKEAAENGAAAVLVEALTYEGSRLKLPPGITVLLVKDTREALAYLSAAWFGYPAKKLCVIGVTGTKGKTTVACILKAMLEAEGNPCGYIGTLGVKIGETSVSMKNTTPESFTIHEYFVKMVEAGCKYAVMEVSSQGLKYKRTEGIEFAAGIFTNLGEDHIGPGEHADLEEYRYCKSLLFRQCRIGIGNIDDNAFTYMFAKASCEVYGYEVEDGDRERKIRPLDLKEDRILRAENIRFRMESGCPVTEFGAGGEWFTAALPGKFNVYNVLAALCTLKYLSSGEAFEHIADRVRPVLKRVTVRGRMERIPMDNNIACYIDYAHNAMSLRKVLEMLRDYQPRRIITVFGCGGNRAKSRRLQMGEVSGMLSDVSVITSDNPRFETPRRIMEDIEEGIRGTGGAYHMIEERGEAIRQALSMAGQGDIILVAGKGHEDYQEIRGVRYPMDDRILIRNVWKEK